MAQDCSVCRFIQKWESCGGAHGECPYHPKQRRHQTHPGIHAGGSLVQAAGSTNANSPQAPSGTAGGNSIVVPGGSIQDYFDDKIAIRDVDEAIKNGSCFCEECRTYMYARAWHGSGPLSHKCMAASSKLFDFSMAGFINDRIKLMGGRTTIPLYATYLHDGNCWCGLCRVNATHGRCMPCKSMECPSAAKLGFKLDHVPNALFGINPVVGMVLSERISRGILVGGFTTPTQTSVEEDKPTYSKKTTFSCDRCNTYNEYAEPNMPNNVYRCYSCRNR